MVGMSSLNQNMLTQIKYGFCSLRLKMETSIRPVKCPLQILTKETLLV